MSAPESLVFTFPNGDVETMTIDEWQTMDNFYGEGSVKLTTVDSDGNQYTQWFKPRKVWTDIDLVAFLESKLANGEIYDQSKNYKERGVRYYSNLSSDGKHVHFFFRAFNHKAIGFCSSKGIHKGTEAITIIQDTINDTVSDGLIAKGYNVGNLTAWMYNLE
jgi:hypothetical protein